MDKLPNVNEYQTFRIIQFTFLSALKIVCFPSVSTYRYVAYRQYTYWIHKKLGRKIGIAIPSCVVRKIRESFQNESRSYRGFEYAH